LESPLTGEPKPPEDRADRAGRIEGVVQIVIMLAIGGAAGAASFTHVHNVAVAHGQEGWLAWADAIVLELMSIASGLELRRRKREGKPVLFPSTVLVMAVVLSLAAQVVEAEPSVIGWTAAALPAAGFLAMVKIAMSRTTSASAGTARRGREPDHRPSRTARDGPGRPADGENGCPADDESVRPASKPEEQEVTDLISAALEVSAELTAEGRPLSREALVERLRGRGHAMSNARASALLKAVKLRSIGEQGGEVRLESVTRAADD
jgi:hypothetical protein